MTKLTTSRKGLQLIKDFEKLQLVAYRCPAGVPTIGYGHTKGVKMGQVITEAQAEDYLKADVLSAERLVNNMAINFRQEQFDALVSWIFNIGGGKFVSSTLCKKIQSGADDVAVADQIVKWVYSNGKPLKGLKKRRIAEANMFLGYEKYYLDKNNNIKKK